MAMRKLAKLSQKSGRNTEKKKKKIWVKENITAQSRVNPKTNLFLSFLLCSFKCQIMKTRNLQL